MDDVYTNYFQKSKVFLYPLLKLKKGLKYVPIQTYVCWEHVYAFKDYKIICEYHAPSSPEFISFYKDYLKNHNLFYKHIDMSVENTHLFIFDLLSLKHDYKRFLKGKYSQFSFDSKLIILDFFSSSGTMLNYIQAFLSPDNSHENYAEALGVDASIIKELNEICSVPNLNKETLVTNYKPLDWVLNKNSIYLKK